MHKLILCLVLSAFLAQAQQPTKFWRASVVALSAANVVDIHSSWGKRELNPLMANNSGTFGARGALLKVALTGSLLGIEYLVTRRHPSSKLYRVLGFVNFGAAAGVAGVAAHNYTVPGVR